jgi:DNA ligase (NAD+)
MERKPEEAPPEEQDAAALPLSGQTIVLTGSLPERTRREATEEIEQRGGTVTSSVSGNTDAVVAGDNPGSKVDDAEERGVRIVRIGDASDFEQFLNGSDGQSE